MPGVVLLAEYFRDEAEHLASVRGVADLPRMVFNGTFEFVSNDELRETIDAVADTVADKLTGRSKGQTIVP